MANDRTELITRVAPNSEILRVYPHAAWSIYAAGTTTPLVASGAADQFGNVSITTLATGHYDMYVDGLMRGSFHHVKADYVQKHPETLTFHIPGTVSGDLEEDENVEQFYAEVVGKILKIKVVVHYADATGDATVHILKGSSQRAAALTVADDSIWSVQCNPGSAVYDWGHVETDANLAIEAQKVLAIGVDFTAGTVKGITLTAIWKAD